MDIVVGSQVLIVGINFCCTKSRDEPTHKVLDDTLEELMEDVRCDRPVDIDIREILPEWSNNWFDTSRGTCLKKASWVIVKGI